jgi:hypothetical protein
MANTYPAPVMFEVHPFTGTIGEPVSAQAVRVLMNEDGEFIEIRIREGKVEIRCAGPGSKSLSISPRFANSIYVELSDA